jgi:hypothetical protein
MFDAENYHRERLANLESTTGPDAEPWATDRRLREYAHQRARLDAAESFDINRADKMRIHIYFGCASLLEYLERRVGYSAHAARERMRVARSLATLPVTAAELAKGNLSFSTVRELSRVATADTEAAWVDRAKFKTCREVEEMVAGHVPGDTPDDPAKPELRMKDLRISLPTEHHALWREARKKLANECGAENVSDQVLFEALCRNFLQPGTGVDGPAHQIAYKQCDDCKRATQNGAGREFPIAPSVLERATCDARIIGSLDAPEPERARSTVSPRMREQVFARDGHRCQIPGCRSSRNLEIHHIIEQALGGPHEMWNLTTLCGGHHAARHEGLLEITGRAPMLKVKWLVPTEPDENDVMRKALLEREIDQILYGRTHVPRGTSITSLPPPLPAQSRTGESDRAGVDAFDADTHLTSTPRCGDDTTTMSSAPSAGEGGRVMSSAPSRGEGATTMSPASSAGEGGRVMSSLPRSGEDASTMSSAPRCGAESDTNTTSTPTPTRSDR